MKSQIDNLYNNYLRWVVAFRIPYDTLNINRKTSFVRFIPFSYNLTLTLPRIQESASAKPGQIDFGLCANISFYSLISMCTVCCTCFKYIYKNMKPCYTPLLAHTFINSMRVFGLLWLMQSECKISNLIPGLGMFKHHRSRRTP